MSADRRQQEDRRQGERRQGERRQTPQNKTISISVFIITIACLIIAFCIALAVIIINYNNKIEEIQNNESQEIFLVPEIDDTTDSLGNLILIE